MECLQEKGGFKEKKNRYVFFPGGPRAHGGRLKAAVAGRVVSKRSFTKVGGEKQSRREGGEKNELVLTREGGKKVIKRKKCRAIRRKPRRP